MMEDIPEHPHVPRYYPISKEKMAKKKPPPIPKVAAWGWHFHHVSVKLLILAVFLSSVSLTTPFWAYCGDAAFGLWMYCHGGTCSSIHDNLVPGKSVPAWYHMTQGSYCIGTVACIVGLGIIMSNVYGTTLKMTATVHRTAVCVLGIAALQLSVSIYTFISYFEHTDFLYDPEAYAENEIDFHGSFYCGVAAIILTIVAALTVVIDDSITRATKVEKFYWATRRATHTIDPTRRAPKTIDARYTAPGAYQRRPKELRYTQ